MQVSVRATIRDALLCAMVQRDLWEARELSRSSSSVRARGADTGCGGGVHSRRGRGASNDGVVHRNVATRFCEADVEFRSESNQRCLQRRRDAGAAVH